MTVPQYNLSKSTHQCECAPSPRPPLSLRAAKRRTPGWPLLPLRGNSPSGNLLVECCDTHRYQRHAPHPLPPSFMRGDVQAQRRTGGSMRYMVTFTVTFWRIRTAAGLPPPFGHPPLINAGGKRGHHGVRRFAARNDSGGWGRCRLPCEYQSGGQISNLHLTIHPSGDILGSWRDEPWSFLSIFPSGAS